MGEFVGWLAIAFGCGAIPSAFVVTRLATGQDIRKLGSGNVGATNVFRNVGLAGGILVLAMDALKGVAPLILFARYGGNGVVPWVNNDPASRLLVVGIAAVLGHVFSPFLKFRGGKGVATSAGVAAFIYPIPFVWSMALFAFILWRTRVMSLASLCAIYLFTFQLVIRSDRSAFAILTAFFLSLFLTWTHRSNISRLINNQEHKFFIKNKHK